MRYWIGALSLTLSFGASAADSCTGPLNVVRYTYSYIDPGAAGTFAGASMDYNNNFLLSDCRGTTTNIVNARPLATDIKFKGVGDITVDPSSSPNGTPSTEVKVTSPEGVGGGWDFDYRIASSPTAGLSFLQNDVVGGRHVLRFAGGGAGLLEVGGLFTSTVVINGDWSNPASRSPSTAYGSGYAVIQDFVFDGTSTRFAVQNTNYNGTDPGISFYLIGAPVPEPGTWALLLLGLGAVVVTRRRQR